MWVAGWHVPYGKLLFKLCRIKLKFRFLGAKPFTDTDSCVRHTLGPENNVFQWAFWPHKSIRELSPPVSG